MTKTHVYFLRPIGMLGPIKIGCSHRPLERLDQLVRWSPWPLEIAASAEGCFPMEKKLHHMFKGELSHFEWFRPSPALLRGIDALLDGKTLEEAFGINLDTGPKKRGRPRKNAAMQVAA